MDQKTYDKINNKIIKFLEEKTSEIDFLFEEIGDNEHTDEINYIITIRNTPKGLLKLVWLRNSINNSKELSVYEFLEEQVADQMSEGAENLHVDFYISLKEEL